jgi:hypothetical protein
MEVKVQRKHFTRHRQNLNQSGVGQLIEQHQTEVETTPIQMQWKEEGFYEGNSESQDGSVELVELLNYDYHVKTNNVKEKKKVLSKCL